MVLSTDVRKTKLTEISRNGSPQGKQKLFYMGETTSFDVHRIDRDCQEFRVWAGIMGKKEFHYVPTQRTCDSV